MPVQTRAIETHAAIVRAAAAIFQVRGYGGASMNDIAAAAGVTKGALYFHFESKEALACALIAAQHDSGMAMVGDLQQVELSGVPAIIWLTFQFSRQLTEDPVVRAGIRLTLESSNLTTPIVYPYQDWITAVEEQLATDNARGELRQGVRIDATARVIIPAFTGVQMVSEVLTGRADLYQRVEEMWELFLPSMVPAERVATLAEQCRTIRRSLEQ